MQQNCQKLSENLFLTRANYLPGDGWIVNGAILRGETTTVVWDTLSKPEDLYFIDELVPRDHRAVAVLSHADWDHCWGTSAFPFDAIIAHHLANDRVLNELPGLLKRYNKRYNNFFANVTIEPPDFVFDQPIALDLGGKTLELTSVPSHTPDSIFGFCAADGVLLVGDAVETVPQVNEARLVPGWIAALRKWAEDPRVKTVIPGHGEIGGVELLHRSADYLSALIEGKTIPTAKLAAVDRSAHRANVKKMKAL